MNKEEIINIVKDLGWRYANNSFIKTFSFKNFDEALNWITNVVTPIARKQNHHPKIMWEYNNVTLVLFTSDTKDITEKDQEFIETLEKENTVSNLTSKYL